MEAEEVGDNVITITHNLDQQLEDVENEVDKVAENLRRRANSKRRRRFLLPPTPYLQESTSRTDTTDAPESVTSCDSSDEMRILTSSLDLEALNDIFQREKIDVKILSEMSHQELMSIGVTSFGDRHRLLRKARGFNT